MLKHIVGVRAKLLHSCLTLCDPTNYSPPGSSIHGIIQARILEWVAGPSPGNLPDPGIKPTFYVSCIAGMFFTMSATWETKTNCKTTEIKSA